MNNCIWCKEPARGYWCSEECEDQWRERWDLKNFEEDLIIYEMPVIIEIVNES